MARDSFSAPLASFAYFSRSNAERWNALPALRAVYAGRK
jgi:hypothetical protein